MIIMSMIRGNSGEVIIDSLVVEHFWSHLCVDTFHKTMPQRTSHFPGAIGVKRLSYKGGGRGWSLSQENEN